MSIAFYVTHDIEEWLRWFPEYSPLLFQHLSVERIEMTVVRDTITSVFRYERKEP